MTKQEPPNHMATAHAGGWSLNVVTRAALAVAAHPHWSAYVFLVLMLLGLYMLYRTLRSRYLLVRVGQNDVWLCQECSARALHYHKETPRE